MKDPEEIPDTSTPYRMLLVVKEKGLVISNVEEKQMEISKGLIKRAAKGGTTLSSDVVENFLKTFPDVNANWLLMKEGPMYKTDPQAADIESDEDFIGYLSKKVYTLESKLKDVDKRIEAITTRGNLAT